MERVADRRWVTLKRQFKSFTVLSLGRLEPEGGVVLGLEIILDDIR